MPSQAVKPVSIGKLLEMGSERRWNPGGDEIKDWPVKIVGLASNGVAVVGITYIVELLRPIPGYEYTHAAAFECHLR